MNYQFDQRKADLENFEIEKMQEEERLDSISEQEIWAELDAEKERQARHAAEDRVHHLETMLYHQGYRAEQLARQLALVMRGEAVKLTAQKSLFSCPAEAQR